MIADLLGRGAGEARTLSYLKNVLALDGRTIRRMIERERRSGVPIISNPGGEYRGYFLANTRAEAYRFYREECQRAFEIKKTAACVLLGSANLPEDYDGAE